MVHFTPWNECFHLLAIEFLNTTSSPDFSPQPILNALRYKMRANDEQAGLVRELCHSISGKLKRVIQLIVGDTAKFGIVQPDDETARRLKLVTLLDGSQELQGSV